MEGFRHVLSIEVRFRDVDLFGHVNNAVIFTYLETAQIRYFVELGVRSPHANWGEAAFILAHTDNNFRKPIFISRQWRLGREWSRSTNPA